MKTARRGGGSIIAGGFEELRTAWLGRVHEAVGPIS